MAAAESKRRDAAMVIRSSPGGAVLRRSTEPSSGSTSTGALSFLERSHRSESSTLPAAVTSPWPVGFTPPQKAKAERDRAARVSSISGGSHRLPRTSALAFLERPPVRSANGTPATSLVSGAEAGLGWLSEGLVSTGSSRGGLLPRSHSSLGSGSEDSDEDIMLMDSSICPSMLFTCFPCFSCFRPRRQPQRWQPEEGLLDGSTSIKRNSRSKKGLGSPLLVDQPLSPEDFPKDVKLIEVEVESARNLPLGERVNMADLAGTYAILRITPGQEGVGEQAAQTSVATRPVNPSWGGRETFTFFVTDTGTGNSQALLSVQLWYRPLRPPTTSARASRQNGANIQTPPPPPMHRETSGLALPPGPGNGNGNGSRPGDVVIGEGFVDLLGLFPVIQGTYTPGALKGNARRVAVPMREPEGKSRTKCSVMLGLRCRRVNETIDTHEDRIYEYERWTPLAGWSTAGRRREGKWSTLDGSVLSDTFSDVAPPARVDAEVVLPWCPFGGWEYSREEDKSQSPPARTSRAHSRTSSRSRDVNRRQGGDVNREKATVAGDGIGASADADADADAEGWDNFSVAQKGAVWMEGYVEGYQAVRRRLWRRVYLEPGPASKGGSFKVVPPPA